ncbi:MFS transporter [Rhodotorula toruloides]|uniref:MFS transporter n=1 Tax=Rhodotorula toruloides TaxID=5286 RepID=A0A511KBB6_RHOTO|nr:MFS transporter [Rhodotorula toruloides]
MEGTGSYAWTFRVSAILCAFTFLLTLALAAFERTFPSCARVPTGRQAAVLAAEQLSPGKAPASFAQRWREERKYFVGSLMALPACFWIMDISQLLQSGAVNAYTSNLADAISTTRNKSKAAAGYTSAIGQSERNLHWVTWTASLYVVVFALLAYTTVHPLVPSILGSLALATNVLPCIASIPLLVPDQARLGTAFGVYKSLNSCGSVIVTVAAGAIQDRSAPGRTEYNAVFAFLIAIKAFDVLLGFSYHFFDKRFLNGVLRSNDRELRRMEEEMGEGERVSALRKPIKTVTVAALAVVLPMIASAWVLYLVYAV